MDSYFKNALQKSMNTDLQYINNLLFNATNEWEIKLKYVYNNIALVNTIIYCLNALILINSIHIIKLVPNIETKPKRSSQVNQHGIKSRY